MKNYRVLYSRDDVAEESSNFTASSDEEAKAYFEKAYANNSNYDWDYLTLLRVDIVEKTTHLGGRMSKKEGVYYHETGGHPL